MADLLIDDANSMMSLSSSGKGNDDDREQKQQHGEREDTNLSLPTSSLSPSLKRRKIMDDHQSCSSTSASLSVSSVDKEVAVPLPPNNNGSGGGVAVPPSPSDCEVVVHITHPYILRQFVEVISNLLSDVDFQIVSTPSFTGLEVATVNETKTCMIQARLTNPITHPQGHFSRKQETNDDDDGLTNFCVSVNTLLKCLEIADQDQIVVLGIEKHVVHFEAFQPNLNGARLNIPIKVSEQDIWLLEQQEFQYTMKFKQSFFRRHVKTLSRLQVNKVDFCLYRPKRKGGDKALSGDVPEDHDVHNLYFAFRGESDDVNDVCIWFHSSTKQHNRSSKYYDDDDGSPAATPSSSFPSDKEHRLVGHTYITVDGGNDCGGIESTDDALVPAGNKNGSSIGGKRGEGFSHNNTATTPNAIPDWDSMEELYRERFLTRYLEYFTKNIDRNDITVYMAPKLPLVLHFPVGDTSYIRFVLMMCDKDTECSGGNGM